MKIIQPELPPVVWKRNGGKDLTLNVKFKDALIRGGLTILIPIVALIINVHLVIYTAPIVVYLFATSLTRYCVVKHLWQYYILKHRIPVTKPYGMDSDYPDETQ
jgi:hypothetical protein